MVAFVAFSMVDAKMHACSTAGSVALVAGARSSTAPLAFADRLAMASTPIVFTLDAYVLTVALGVHAQVRFVALPFVAPATIMRVALVPFVGHVHVAFTNGRGTSGHHAGGGGAAGGIDGGGVDGGGESRAAT